MKKGFRIENGKIVTSEESVGPIFMYIDPGSDERKYLIDTLQIDEHNINSALDPDELGRLEYDQDLDMISIILKGPKNYSTADNLLFKVTSMGIFILKSCMVIVMPEYTPVFEGKQLFKCMTIQDVLLRVIYNSIAHFLSHLKVINMITESLEHKINESMDNKHLLNMFTLEKSLVYYLNAINSNSMVIDKIRLNSGRIMFSEENIEFLDDIIIENTQCFKQAEIYANILTGLMDARASIVSNNLNVLMKTLNIITISIMVPTFVVSAFSMNVGIPFSRHPFAFWMIMGLAALALLGFFVFWKLKRW